MTGAISSELMFKVPFTIRVPQYCAPARVSPDSTHWNTVLLIKTARPARMYNGMIVAKASRRDRRWISFPSFEANMVNFSTTFESPIFSSSCFCFL